MYTSTSEVLRDTVLRPSTTSKQLRLAAISANRSLLRCRARGARGGTDLTQTSASRALKSAEEALRLPSELYRINSQLVTSRAGRMYECVNDSFIGQRKGESRGVRGRDRSGPDSIAGSRAQSMDGPTAPPWRHRTRLRRDGRRSTSSCEALSPCL